MTFSSDDNSTRTRERQNTLFVDKNTPSSPLLPTYPQLIHMRSHYHACSTTPTLATSRLTDGGCPFCKGAGYTREDVPYGHPKFGKAQKCACKQAEERVRHREQLHLLSGMQHLSQKTFDTFNRFVPGVQTPYRLAYLYAQQPAASWLLLVGPYGCGKTHLTAAIGNFLLQEGQNVLFVTVPDLLDHLRASYAPTSPVTYDQRFTLLGQAEVLLLDDMGSQQTTNWAEEKLFQLINYRYVRRMPTVITTNHVRLYGIHERILSRMRDTGLVREVVFDEGVRDYRQGTQRKRS